MGMFDTFYFDGLYCPYCGKITKDVQSKSLKCNLEEYKISDKVDIQEPNIILKLEVIE